jgi:hypothetical protein
VTRRSTTLTGAAGEHYVMYRLLKLGHLAALTPTGAKGVDILISDGNGQHLAATQVKTSGEPVTVGWRMDAKHEEMSGDRLFYCFIDPTGSSAAPSCWIVPSAVVAKHVYSTHRAWLSGTPMRGSTRRDGPGRKMHLVCSNPPLDDYPNGWMDQYKEAWDLLRQVAP